MQEAEAGAARKAFDLRLEGLGPYNLDFSRSGRHLLIGGRKGHLGLMEWQTGHTFCEVQVGPLCVERQVGLGGVCGPECAQAEAREGREERSGRANRPSAKFR